MRAGTLRQNKKRRGISGISIWFTLPCPPKVSDVVAGSAHLVHAPAGVRGAGVVPRASEMSDHTLNCASIRNGIVVVV